ncbi:MAG TPA: addiction module protein [Kofleriaceae bacterium]|nr:addiction module protein [Kofleriaceae bacterium]
MAVEKIIQEALALPPEDRARLADALYDSLEPDEEWEKAWAVEVERRIKDLDEGRTRAIPAEEVFAELRARFPLR